MVLPVNSTSLAPSSIVSPDWLTAVATLLAVVVAALALAPQIYSWIFRPKLSTEFKNEPPFCTHSLVPWGEPVKENEVTKQPVSNGYFLRLRIRNKNRITARNVQGKMIRILDPNTLKEPQNIRFDPSILNWAPPPHDKVSLNKDDFDFLDVVQVVQVDTVLRIPALELRVKEPRGLTFAFPRGNYFLDVSIYAKNAYAVQRRYRLTCGTDWDDVKLEEIAQKFELPKF
jgi:hypothetical protein